MSEQRTQVVTVVGNSGLGKTRLVAEFYKWLSKTHDAAQNGYWPESLTKEGRNLEINPRPADCNTKVQPPFYWTGMRLPDPSAVNSSLGSVVQYGAASFGAHLQELFEYHRSEKPGAQLKSIFRAVSVDLASDKLIDYAADLVPIPGMKILISIGRAIYDEAKHKDDADATSLSPEQHFRRSEDLVADSWLETLSSLYSVKAQNNQAKQIGHVLARPFVLFVDDAQWAYHDPTLVAFLREVLSNSAWPMMVVLTCWKVDWNQNPIIRHLAAKNGHDASNVIMLQPHNNLLPAVKAALPGIGNTNSSLFLEKAGGNPAALQMLIASFKQQPRYFEELDVTGRLNSNGDKKLRDSQTVSEDIRKLAESVLRDAEDPMRAVLAVSAWQGTRFVSRLTDASEKALDKDWAVRDALRLAEDPYALIESESEDVSEFSQRIYWETAKDSFADFVTEPQRRKILLSLPSAVLSILNSDAEDSTKLTCGDVALNLLSSSKSKATAYVLCRAAMELSNSARRRYDFRAAASYATRFDRIFREGKVDLRSLDKGDIASVADSLEYADVEGASLLLDRLLSITDANEDTRFYATILGHAARVARKMGSAHAYDYSVKCVETFSRIYDNEQTPEATRDLAVAFGLMADLAILAGRTDEAREFAQRALALLDVEIEIASAQQRRDASHAYARLSRMVLPHDAEGARNFADRSINLARRNAMDEAGPYAKRDLALALLAAVDSYIELHNIEPAKNLMAECLAILAPLEKSASWTARRDLALALWRASRLHAADHDFDRALHDLDESLRFLSNCRGPQAAIETLLTLRRAQAIAERCEDDEAAGRYGGLARRKYNEIYRSDRNQALWASQRLDNFEDRRDVMEMMTMSPSLATRWFHRGRSYGMSSNDL